MEEKEINKILKPGKLIIIITIIAIIGTLALFGAGIYNDYESTKNPEDLGALIDNGEDKEGKYAKIDVATTAYGFAKEDNNRCYYFVKDTEGYMYIVRMKDSTFDKLEKMYNNGEGEVNYEFKGYTFKISASLKRLAIEAANEGVEDSADKMTTANFENYVGSVYIDETKKPTDDTSSTFYGMGTIAAIFTICLAIAAITQILNVRKITKNTELMEELRNELSSNTDDTYKKLKLYLTDRYVISRTAGIEAFTYKDVIWEYSLIRYVNGVAQGKTLIIFTRDKKRHNLAATGPNDERIEEIMTEISDKNPNVRVGYTKENRQFFKEFKKEQM